MRKGSATPPACSGSIRVPSTSPGSSIDRSVDYKLTVKDNHGLAAISPVGSTFLPLSYWYPTPNSWYFARGADYAPFQIKVNPGGLNVVSAGSGNSGYDQLVEDWTPLIF